MRHRHFAIIATVLLVLLVGSGGVLVADASTRSRIPNGVTIGGIPVGGMRADEARSTVRDRLLDRLNRPVRVGWGGREWTLSAKRAGVAVDVDGAVAKALDAGREGNAFSRVVRKVTGGSVDRRFEPTSSYSKTRVRALVDRVAQAVDRDPKSAAVTLDGRTLDLTKGQTGLTVQQGRLTRAVRRALLDPSAAHRITARTTKEQPQTTTAAVKKKYSTALVADRDAFKVTVYRHLKPVKSYPIAVGKVGHLTPAGQYTISSKEFNPVWHVPNSDWAGSLAGQTIPAGSPQNPIKGRWIGIVDGVGFHGTDDAASVGRAASHGCLRMHIPDVKALYDQTPLGAPVWIL